MHIFVFNVAASELGALAILHDYYNRAKQDPINNYTFVISTPSLDEMSNIKVINYPWIKKSLLHRIFFDYFIAHKLIGREIDVKVVSLQNIPIPRYKFSQNIYLHNIIPFSDIKFSLFVEFNMWFRKKVIGKFIEKRLHNKNLYYVQSNWFKKILVDQTLLKSERIVVEKPKIKPISEEYYFNKKAFDNNPRFIYPAGPFPYKNHVIITKVSRKLKELNYNHTITFTINYSENSYSKKLRELIKKFDLPIKMVGRLSEDELFREYSQSALIFPSKLETYGLPLYEAKEIKSPVLAINYEYSREALKDYTNATFFENDTDDLLDKIITFLRKDL